MGATRRGRSKGKGPRRRERSICSPFAGEEAGQSDFPSPASSSLSPSSCSPPLPCILRRRGCGSELLNRTSQAHPEGAPGQTPPHPKTPGLGWEGHVGVLAPQLLILPPSHPASQSLSFAVWEMGVQGSDSQSFSTGPSSSPLTFRDSQGQGPIVSPLTPCPMFTGDRYPCGRAPSPRAKACTSQTAAVQV